MSWSGQVATKVSTCGEFTINFETINNQPDVCYAPSEEKIYATILNAGLQIEGISSSVIGSRDVLNKDYFINIGPNEIYKLTLDYPARVHGAPKKLVIMPFYQKGTDINKCDDRRVEVTELPTCAS